MRLALSNIAWDVSEDAEIAVLLQRYCIDAIDVAPGKYFADFAAASDADIARVRAWWAERGMDITGMQALLFGTTGLNLFGPPPVQDAMMAHLAAVCRIGAGLGAVRLVFGSPRNRDRLALEEDEAVALSVPFFRRLGNIAGSFGVTVCLEPNPVRYGANFMTTSAETARVVAEVAHPAIRMQFDTGALSINGEDPAEVLGQYAGLVGHVHASDGDLVPLGDGATDHGRVAEALRRHLPGHVVAIEMVATKDEPHPVSIERALQVAVRDYRTPAGATA